MRPGHNRTQKNNAHVILDKNQFVRFILAYLSFRYDFSDLLDSKPFEKRPGV